MVMIPCCRAVQRTPRMSESGIENSLLSNVCEWNSLKLHICVLRLNWSPARPQHLFSQKLPLSLVQQASFIDSNIEKHFVERS